MIQLVNLIRRWCTSKFFVITFITFILAGCREPVENEFPDFTPVPTVNSFLAADSLFKVHVSLAGKMDTVPLTLVEQATLTYFVNDSSAGELTLEGNGYYTSKRRVKAGNIYRVKVTIPGYPEISATDTIPEQVQLTSVEHINQAGVNEEGYPFPAIRITFPVNPDRIQYFQVIVKVNNYKDIWRPAYFRDFSDTVLLAEGLPIAVFSTARIRIESYTLKLDYSPSSYYGSNGVLRPNLDPLVVEFKTISYSYYQYLRQLYLYETGRYPDFGFGPLHTFPLYSNVTNGMGIMAGYSLFRSEIIIPGN